MIAIGLICEGVSEINIITRIVLKYLGEDVVIHPIEPETKTENGFLVQSGYGGWQQVLSHCNDEKVEEILEYNDYLIIQIDTDTCSQPGYDVNLLDAQGVQKTPDVLYIDIKDRIQKNISPEVLNKYDGRIIFAICMNEIECWLLPLYYSNANRCKNHNCIFTLNAALGKKGIGSIPDKTKNSPFARSVYQKILKNFKSKKSIQDCAQYHYGFGEFVNQLDVVQQRAELQN